ncbi:DUF3263 domain-containing protein [Kineosporia sp. J2-2]|uniref:DUF3263 domain-containing protein n=1 Tax=Kineosporia corallincola TaxID=2835133 RepID=A0ABS5TCU9_9ACTN|nr:DUF3263 domain-containing protein [Kineosporia corallincola]MBT0767454.1 DUF3263 domain-containing protein [Kineosporia corallincola]
MESEPETPVASAANSALTSREVEILAFERQWFRFAGAKEQAIRELFDMTSTRYYQVLNTLIDRPEALAADPMLVKRLRRMRQTRRRSGSARSLDAHG